MPLFQINLWPEEIMWWIYSTSFHNPATCLQEKKKKRQQLNYCSHTMIIYSAPRSSPQPLDLCLLSPTSSAYSAMRSVPESHLINDYQPLDHRLISFTISTYSAAWSEPVRQLISTSQPLDHFPHVLKQKLWSRAQQSCFTKPCSRDAGDAKVRATAHLSSAQDHSNAVYQYPLLNTNKPKPMIKIFLLSKVPSSYHCFSPLPKASVALSPFLH